MVTAKEILEESNWNDKDNKNKLKTDRKFISFDEPYEVDYWTERFDCTEDELQTAVDEVGHSVEKVEKWFASR